MGQHITAIHVYKSVSRMDLLSGADVVRSYHVSFGHNYRDGHKEREGDKRTPEGQYVIDYHKSDSRFHRALHVSYPSPRDRKEGRTGGLIMVHGQGPEFNWAGPDHYRANWTDGCIAVTDAEIEEIYAMVGDQTPITIHPMGTRPAVAPHY